MFTAKAAHWGARSGVLAANGKEIATPAFMVATTRGAVPHITPDHAMRPPVAGVYAEELWDINGLAEAAVDRDSLPLATELVLASARAPGSRDITNKPNTVDMMAIDTVQGSRLAPLATINQFMRLVRPDVMLVPYDAPAQSPGTQVGKNRVKKMEARSLAWLKQFATEAQNTDSLRNALVVAPIPSALCFPSYVDDMNPLCAGYAFVDQDAPKKMLELGDPTKLRLSERPTANWADVLAEIAAGADLVYVPLTPFADAGQALMLDFSASEPLFIDLTSTEYAVDTAIVGKTGHSRAYIHHLLQAEEMTAQVLLQLHNHAMVEQLFRDIRSSIERGAFEADSQQFLKKYYP